MGGPFRLRLRSPNRDLAGGTQAAVAAAIVTLSRRLTHSKNNSWSSWAEEVAVPVELAARTAGEGSLHA